ncbi:hypothetical protein CDV31_016922, partial [Fusarium ambrosium]
MGTHQSIPLIEPPDNPEALGKDFTAFLSQFQQFELAPYIHHKAISFNNAAHRANW